MSTKEYLKQKEDEKLKIKLDKLNRQREQAQDRKRKSIEKRGNNRLDKVKQEIKEKSLKKYTKRERASLKRKDQKIKNTKRLIKGKAEKVYDNKTLSRRKKEAFKRFQYRIRLSDTNENGYGTCISSGVARHYKGADAGHIFGKHNYPHLAFDPMNCRLQSKRENKKQLDGMPTQETMRRLKEKIGEVEYNALLERADDKSLKEEARKRDKQHFRSIAEEYKEKALLLEKEKGQNNQ